MNITTKYAVKKKSLITVKHLYKLYILFGDKRMSFANLRTMMIFLFSVLGFLHSSEVINTRRTDVI